MYVYWMGLATSGWVTLIQAGGVSWLEPLCPSGM